MLRSFSAVYFSFGIAIESSTSPYFSGSWTRMQPWL